MFSLDTPKQEILMAQVEKDGPETEGVQQQVGHGERKSWCRRNATTALLEMMGMIHNARRWYL